MELQAVVNLIKNQYKVSKESELINFSLLILLVIFGIILLFVSDYVKFSSYCLMSIGAVLILFSLGCGIVNSIEKSKRKFFRENLRESDILQKMSPQSLELLIRYFREKSKIKNSPAGTLFKQIIFSSFISSFILFFAEKFSFKLLFQLDHLLLAVNIFLYVFFIVAEIYEIIRRKETENRIIADALYDFLLEKRFRQINQ